MNTSPSQSQPSDKGVSLETDESGLYHCLLTRVSNNQKPKDEVDLMEIWNLIWRVKWVILIITAISVCVSALYAFSLANVYRSSALLVSSEASQGGMPRLGGQLGGLASLAGVSIGNGGATDKVAVALAVLRSRSFISGFVDRHDILPQLIAVEDWDRATDTLVYDGKLYDKNKESWIRESPPYRTVKPTSWEAYKAFLNILSVSREEETGFVTIAIEHYSPYLARDWVNLLVNDVNRVMKEKDVEEARRSMAFLQKEISTVALADMRTIFYQLIEEQVKTIMLSEVRGEYVFSTIDEPVAPEEKSGPNRLLILFLGAATGGMLSLVFVLFHYYLKDKRPLF